MNIYDSNDFQGLVLGINFPQDERYPHIREITQPHAKFTLGDATLPRSLDDEPLNSLPIRIGQMIAMAI